MHEEFWVNIHAHVRYEGTNEGIMNEIRGP
jgi:hypothetical protein